jgi:predicted AAA+ superfamily ATPase
MYLKRTLERFILEASDQFSVILITGPRQVGKTTILKHISTKDRKYVTLDDPRISLLAQEEPSLFLERYPPPILIDEIQYAPQLLAHIKMYVDIHQSPGDFWLTGSQQFHLMQGVSESLAGRVAILNLIGLSLAEIEGDGENSIPFLPLADRLQRKYAKKYSTKELYDKIWKGFFPKIITNPKTSKNLFYSSYVQTYLQRDVRELANVGSETKFLKFLRAAAARTGQLLNITDMARDADISPVTAKNWLSILEASYIVYLLEPYHNNVSKRLVKAPKLYFLDTGLATYLTEWLDPEVLEAGAMSGAILETFIFTEILKSYWHNGRRASLFYYRDKDKKEVDLLIVQNDNIYPIEFKKTALPTKDAIRNFKTLENNFDKVREGAVICLSDEILPITNNVISIPAWII